MNRISECGTLLQCHMCGDQGFSTEELKVREIFSNFSYNIKFTKYIIDFFQEK